MKKTNRVPAVCIAAAILVLLTLACSNPLASPPATPVPPTNPPVPTTPPVENTLAPTVPPPPPTTPQPSTIYGVLWHDTCQFTGGEGGQPVVLGQGCVQYGSTPAEFGPNQVRDSFETGWAGVTLHIGPGNCPSLSLLTAVTNANGEYRFDNLGYCIYCVWYSNLTDGNDAILIPGGPTFPQRGDTGFSQTISLADGENKQVDFGYAWQFFN